MVFSSFGKYPSRKAMLSRRRRPLRIDTLEDRAMPTVLPVSLADQSLAGISGISDSSHASISADGQLIAFQSDSDNLVPNDSDRAPDVFVYNRTTGIVTLISVGSTGVAGGGQNPVISPDGRYAAFESNSRGILQSFTNDGNTQIFLRDLETNTTTLVTASATVGGAGGDFPSSEAIFSADSHHLGFISRADNLVTGIAFHTNTGSPNLFTEDLTTGSLAMVSVSEDGAHDADFGVKTSGFGMSADGQSIVFSSISDNLAGAKYNPVHASDVFLRNMETGVTTQVSVNLTHTGGGNNTSVLADDNGYTSGPGGVQSMSADGRYVVFDSTASDLVPQTTTGGNIFLYDRTAGTIALVDFNTSGTGPGQASDGIISPDGRYVAFVSTRSLLSNDTNGVNDVYVYDTQSGTLSLASVSTNGTLSNGTSGYVGSPSGNNGGLAFSADGRSLVFRSAATNLTNGVVTSAGNLFLRNLTTNTTTLLTPNQTSTDGGNGDVFNIPVMSADGRYVVFTTTDSNLVAGDTNGVQDVYVRDIEASHPVLAAPRSPWLPSYNLAQLGGNIGNSSADGRYVVFASNVNNGKSDIAPSVVFNTAGGGFGIYVRDEQTGLVQVVDLLANGQEAGSIITNPQDEMPYITPDGRYVVFRSKSTALVPGITYTAGATNIFVRDLQTQTTRLASVDPSGTHDVPVPTDTQYAISDDTRYIAFTTNIAAPFSGVSNGNLANHYVLWHDFGDGVSTPTTVLVSHDQTNDGVINGDSRDISISSDGRYVAFRSLDATISAVPDNNGAYDVFRWDRTTGLDDLVSINMSGTGTGDRESSAGYPPSMTPDGRYIAFESSAYDLVAGMDTSIVSPRYEGIYKRDMGDGVTSPSTSLVATGYSTTDPRNATAPSISATGIVTYLKPITIMLPPPPDPNPKTIEAAFAGAAQLAAGTDDSGGFTLTTNLANKGPIISPNGEYVAYWSKAEDIIPNFDDKDGAHGDLYLFDSAGGTKLISWNDSGTASATVGQDLDLVRFSPDSKYLYFQSTSLDLVPGDNSAAVQTYVATTAGFSSIGGQVFADTDGHVTRGAGLQYWLVYLDSNNNGVPDVGEPEVVTDGQGNYDFRNLTSGTYTVRIVPEAGYTQTLPVSPQSYSVTIAADGTAITGKDFGEFLPLPDLAASNVTFNPTSAVASQTATISWTVSNQGNSPAVGGWQDAAYLSPTPTLNPSAQLLTIAPHNADLAANQSYTGNATVALPPMPGTWYVVVQTDRRHQITEGFFGANRANDIAASASTLNLTIPPLVLNASAGDTLSGLGPDRYYQISAPTGKSLVLALSSAASTGQIDLFVRRGALPTPFTYDFAAHVADQRNQTLTIPAVQAGTYYVLVHGVNGSAVNSAFTLTATEPGVTLQYLGLVSAGNTGSVTIPIHGTDLTANTPIALVQGLTSLTPTAINVVDPSLAYATFNLAGQAAGNWTLVVGSGGQSAQFEITKGEGPNLQVHLGTPAAVRTNHPYADLIVDYENTGDTDMPAPVFSMTSTGKPNLGFPWVFLQLEAGGQPVTSKAASVQFIGQGQDSPGGVLRAGDKGEVKVAMTFNFVSAGGGPQIEIDLSTLPTDTTPISWNSVKAQLQPPSIPDDAWNLVFDNFTEAVGSTAGQLQSTVVADTAYLNQIGVENPSFADVMAFEMMRANAALPTPILASTTDVAFPDPSLGLDFSRSFLQSISGRNTIGDLGLGWVSDWDISESVESDGTVLVNDAGVPREFTPLATGGFAATPGDHGILTFTNGVYQLIETDGAKTVFLANGKLNYIQDTNGNRITAGYNGNGQMNKLTDSDGQALTIGYNPQGFISSITDPNSQSAASYSYDPAGHLLSVTTTKGVTQYGYVTGTGNASDNALASIINPDGTQVHYTYDNLGRLTGNFMGTVASPVDPVTITYPSPGSVTFTGVHPK
jgi:YD repeat-containing protein